MVVVLVFFFPLNCMFFGCVFFLFARRVRRSREATALESPREWPLAHPAVDSVHGRVGQGHASTCTGCSTEKAEREQELGGGQQRGVVRDKLAS